VSDKFWKCPKCKRLNLGGWRCACGWEIGTKKEEGRA
jgi:hypothetical protein